MNMRHLRVVLVLLLVLGCMPETAMTSAPWWNANWRFRVPVTADPGSVSRNMKPAEIALNFTQLLSMLGQSGTLSESSIRVVEVTAGGTVINDTVQFQFDKDPDFQAATKASGTLVILMDGLTPAGSTRQFHVYFDLAGRTFTPAQITPRVQFTDDIPDEGQSSYRIQTEIGTYFYHKQGAGFSSIVDLNGNDWIGYHPTYSGSTAGGPSRGLPNPVYPRGYFHPGSMASASTVLNSGPLKVTIRSVTVADEWECRWEIYPRYARLTMVSGDSTYWLLYEGTPGGLLEVNKDIVVTSDNSQVLASQSWTRDIPGDEWAYFGDPTLNRSFFMAHHNADDVVDSYRPMDGLMTVFGFGRQSAGSYMTDFPAILTVGLVDAVDFATMSTAINNAYKDLTTVAGSPEANTLPGVPTQLAPPNGSFDLPDQVNFHWTASPLSIVYGLQISTDSAFAGGFVVNDSTLVDTSRTVAGLLSSRTYFWRVFGRNASGKGPMSETWRFETAGNAPAAVILTSPGDLSAVPSDSVRFVWEPGQPDADRYWFELGFDEAFAFRVVDSALVDTVRVARGLMKNHTYYWRVRARNGRGWGPFSEVRRIQTILTDVDPAAESPAGFELHQNYPNPFNPATRITYTVGGASGQPLDVRLRVYDLLGREVAVLVSERQVPGTYSVEFVPARLAAGVYLYRLEAHSRGGDPAASFSAVRSLVLLK